MDMQKLAYNDDASFTFQKIKPIPSYVYSFWWLEKNLDRLAEVPAVYVFLSYNKITLYTGETKNLRSRIKQHIKGSHNEDLYLAIRNGDVANLLIFECSTELDAIMLERYLITGNQYCGIYNKTFNEKTHKKNQVNLEDKGTPTLNTMEE
ncbi:hypothetical protein CON15_19295 [Bacillus cereus]|uniref:GIY-YIG domain-containing protein n=2 Tax=Bacillus TaxID=1386 RepID=A0AB36VG13_BACTU|nr:hypothetical protein CON15_19295 [Bacillus cereus]PES54455.1 hypothetical protein CN506_20480 [Bacillus thuringiensis]PFO26237.1 hypothetical protein COJ78_29480 [Bacillus thuringiensis]PFS40307.1 hypothetical protein COK48_00250 [Bacillus thuringiensis]PFS58236.1 hypothetical protein COK64_17805 [Bacillus thuringiensis]